VTASRKGTAVGNGVTELGDRLGPIVWQFMPTKAFDAEDFEAFLALLPDKVDGWRLRYVMDVRHDSFTQVPAVPAGSRLQTLGFAGMLAHSTRTSAFA
jgi:uncharacterized protein YecE (DUF72 family)